MCQRRRKLMVLGGWVFLILCSNSRGFVLAKFFLSRGKCIQLKASGMEKQMVENAQSILLVRKLQCSKQNNLSNRGSTFKCNQMIDGLIILNIESKFSKIQNCIFHSCKLMKKSLINLMFQSVLWLLQQNQKFKEFGKDPHKQIS